MDPGRWWAPEKIGGCGVRWHASVFLGRSFARVVESNLLNCFNLANRLRGKSLADMVPTCPQCILRPPPVGPYSIFFMFGWGFSPPNIQCADFHYTHSQKQKKKCRYRPRSPLSNHSILLGYSDRMKAGTCHIYLLLRWRRRNHVHSRNLCFAVTPEEKPRTQ